jgi:hypothetical protein
MDTDFDLNHWNSITKLLKVKYPQLTDADLIWRHETKDDFFKMIASNLGETKKRFEEVIESL